MDRRPAFQDELETLLGSEYACYQAPDTRKMQYPAIRYELKKIDSKYANNKRYLRASGYKVVLLTWQVDDPLIYKIMDTFTMCEYVSHYTVDNLHHHEFIIYY